MTEIQAQVAEFVAQHGLEAPLPYRMLDLCAELGELSKELLKATAYGQRAFRPQAAAPAWEDELGDVLFSLVCVANVTGVNLEAALESALTKYRRRMEQAGRPDSGR